MYPSLRLDPCDFVPSLTVSRYLLRANACAFVTLTVTIDLVMQDEYALLDFHMTIRVFGLVLPHQILTTPPHSSAVRM